MLVLNIPEKNIKAEIPAAERKLQRSPDGWSGMARMGKLLRLSGDRRGLDLLREAAERWLAASRNDTRPETLILAVSLLRLAGDDRRCTELLQILHRKLTESIRSSGYDDTNIAMLVEASFLLGLDEEALETNAASAAVYPKGVPSDLRFPIVAGLAAARSAGDPAGCDPAIRWFDRAIARERESCSDTGDINLHDWLEIALNVQAELSGEVSPRLRKI